MRQTAGVADMMTLARLHAALDSVVEARELIAAIDASSPTPPPALAHVGMLFDEARELLRELLTPPDRGPAVGTART